MQHNLAHMPYRSWCPICIQERGRSDAHPQRNSSRLITHFDFASLKGFEDQYPTRLAAIDIERGLCSASLVPNNATMMDYCVHNTIAFIMETGRTSAAVPSKILGIPARHSPAYSSQSQGSIERLHRTLFGQARVIREKFRTNYGLYAGCNTQPCNGSSATAAFLSTTTSSTVMEYQTTSEDGSQTARLPSASLEKAFSTCHQQPSRSIPNLRTDSIQAFGLERTHHQEDPMLG